MFIYLAVAAFPLLVESVYGEHLNRNISSARKMRWLYLLVATIPFFAMIGFRNQSLGADTIQYIESFTRTAGTTWQKLFDITEDEHGYYIFIKLLAYISRNPLFYQVMCALVYFVAVYTFCLQMERSPFLFLFLFATTGTFTFMFTAARQCLAMSICLFSYVFIRKRKLIPFILLVILAFFFHKSAVLFLIVYFIYNRKLSIPNTAFYVIAFSFCVVFIDYIQMWMNELLDYEYGIESTGNGVVFFVFIFTLTALSIAFLYSYGNMNKESRGYVNVGLISLLLWTLRLFTRVAERPAYYFIFFSYAMIAYALDAIPKMRDRYIAKTIVVALCLLLFVYRLNSSTLVPYSFYN